MIRYFQTNSPVNIVLLFVYAFLLKLHSFMHPQIPVAQATDGFVFLKLLDFLSPAGNFAPVIYPLIVLVLILSQAIMFSNYLNKHKLLPKPNFLPAMAYVFITALFPEWWLLSSALIVNCLLVWVWASLSDLFNNTSPKALVYNTGLAVGIASFLYFPAIGFILLIFFALITMRPFQLSEWLIAVLGVLTPYYFLFSYLFLTKDWNPLTYLPSVSVSLPQFQQDIWAWVAIVLIIVPFLISGFYIQGNMLRMLIQVRKSWSLMLIYLLISMLIPFVNVVSGFEYWILCSLPFAAFHAYTYFFAKKRWIPIVLHWLFVAFIVALNIWLPAAKG